MVICCVEFESKKVASIWLWTIYMSKHMSHSDQIVLFVIHFAMKNVSEGLFIKVEFRKLSENPVSQILFIFNIVVFYRPVLSDDFYVSEFLYIAEEIIIKFIIIQFHLGFLIHLINHLLHLSLKYFDWSNYLTNDISWTIFHFLWRATTFFSIFENFFLRFFNEVFFLFFVLNQCARLSNLMSFVIGMDVVSCWWK